jgi:hypothetical protein
MPSVTDDEMSDPPHRAQLLVCHEKIAGRHYAGGHTKASLQYCDLSAYAWCFTHDMYVCDIHLNARHTDGGCDTVIEFPRQTFRPGTPAGRLRRAT